MRQMSASRVMLHAIEVLESESDELVSYTSKVRLLDEALVSTGCGGAYTSRVASFPSLELYLAL